MKRTVLILLIIIFSGFTLSQNGYRVSKNNKIYSSEKPNITIEVSDEFQYLGKLNFTLFESASVERFLYGVITNDTIKKMIAFQFVMYLPNNEYTYKRTYKDSIKMGAYWFGNYHVNNLDITHIGNFISKWKGKGLEHEVTYNHLEENNFNFEDVILSDSFIYYGSDLRHELVISYYENLSNYNLKMSDLKLKDDFTRAAIPKNIYELSNNSEKFNEIINFSGQMMGSFNIIN